MTKDRALQFCGCCRKPRSSWDYLYGCCGGCAWCWSLEHDKCCHGECYPPIAAQNRADDESANGNATRLVVA
jgi:hypothetical protein